MACRLAGHSEAGRCPGPSLRRRRPRPLSRQPRVLHWVDAGSLGVGSPARCGPPEPAPGRRPLDLPARPLLVLVIPAAYWCTITQTRVPILVIRHRVLVVALEFGSSAGWMRACLI